MADRNGYIDVEGLDRVLKSLEKADKATVEAAMVGMEEVGMEIIEDAKDNLRENGSIITGLLRAAGRTIRKGIELTVGFFDTTNRNSGYALYVEYGRRAGKMPPPDELAAWAYKKFHLQDWPVANSMGWALARRIAAQGTEPHPFFNPAVKKHERGFEKAIRNAFRKKLK